MKDTPRYRTWRRSRGNRLPAAAYPQGIPAHLILGTPRRHPRFEDPGLAAAVFALVENSPATLAACLMPDHLHWLIDDAATMSRTVARFKAFSTRAARRLGVGGSLWQRSFWDHVVRSDENLRELAQYIVHNPMRAGLVPDYRDYPYQTIRRL